jgi:hypothetical protein
LIKDLTEEIARVEQLTKKDYIGPETEAEYNQKNDYLKQIPRLK